MSARLLSFVLAIASVAAFVSGTSAAAASRLRRRGRCHRRRRALEHRLPGQAPGRRDFYGRFNKIAGEVALDDKDGERQRSRSTPTASTRQRRARRPPEEPGLLQREGVPEDHVQEQVRREEGRGLGSRRRLHDARRHEAAHRDREADGLRQRSEDGPEGRLRDRVHDQAQRLRHDLRRRQQGARRRGQVMLVGRGDARRSSVVPEIPSPESRRSWRCSRPRERLWSCSSLGAWLAAGERPGSPPARGPRAIAVAFAWTFVRIRGFPRSRRDLDRARCSGRRASRAALGLVAAFPRPARARADRGVAAAVPRRGLGRRAGFPPSAPGWRLGAVALGAVAWLHLLVAALEAPGPLFGFVTAIAWPRRAQIFLMFHAAQLGQLGGALGIAMGLIGLASLVFRRPLPGIMALPLGAAMIVLSLDAALFAYEPPPPVALVLLAAAPLAPLVSFGGRPSARRPSGSSAPPCSRSRWRGWGSISRPASLRRSSGRPSRRRP